MQLKFLFLIVLSTTVYYLVTSEAQAVNGTISCTSCTSYTVTVGNITVGTVTCPVGTVCSVATNTSICSSSNPCDGQVCNRYAVFASSATCSQYHVCRYNRGYATYVLSTYSCPGKSLFDRLIGKCTLSESVNCYNGTTG